MLGRCVPSKPWYHNKLCLQQIRWSQLDTQNAVGRLTYDLSVARYRVGGADLEGGSRVGGVLKVVATEKGGTL